KRLQEWYKKMLDRAILEHVVIDYKDIMKDCTDNQVQLVTNIPYFEGDFWSNIIEESIKELDQEEEQRRKIEEVEAARASEDFCLDDPIEPEDPTEISDKRKLANTHKKKSLKKAASQRKTAKKQMSNVSDLLLKIFSTMEKHKEAFFVIRLRSPLATHPPVNDTDALIQCDLMDTRDSFLNFARDKHHEFSTLRRAKFSTMAILYELHSSTTDKFTYNCDQCRQPCDARYHCTVCEDYDLCLKCYQTVKHEHKMDRSDDVNHNEEQNNGKSDGSGDKSPANTQLQRHQTMQRCIEAILHAVNCRNANCINRSCLRYKRIIQHTKDCKIKSAPCTACKHIIFVCWYHAKSCNEQNCQVPFCTNLKAKIQKQRATNHQMDRRRMYAMRAESKIDITNFLSIIFCFPGASGPSPLNQQHTDPVNTFHQSVGSPCSGKPTPMIIPSSPSTMMSSNRLQPHGVPMPAQQHACMNGGKGNPMPTMNQPWVQQSPRSHPININTIQAGMMNNNMNNNNNSIRLVNGSLMGQPGNNMMLRGTPQQHQFMYSHTVPPSVNYPQSMGVQSTGKPTMPTTMFIPSTVNRSQQQQTMPLTAQQIAYMSQQQQQRLQQQSSSNPHSYSMNMHAQSGKPTAMLNAYSNIPSTMIRNNSSSSVNMNNSGSQQQLNQSMVDSEMLNVTKSNTIDMSSIDDDSVELRAELRNTPTISNNSIDSIDINQNQQQMFQPPIPSSRSRPPQQINYINTPSNHSWIQSPNSYPQQYSNMPPGSVPPSYNTVVAGRSYSHMINQQQNSSSPSHLQQQQYLSSQIQQRQARLMPSYMSQPSPMTIEHQQQPQGIVTPPPLPTSVAPR
ncbi:unnamed protein product, partial [Didymodactylos carnosus]